MRTSTCEHKADVKTVLMLVGVFVANIVLIDLLGWVISGVAAVLRARRSRWAAGTSSGTW